MVRSCRGAAVEGSPAISDPDPAQARPRPDFWKSGNLGPGNLNIWNLKKAKTSKSLKSKIRSAKMSTRSGLVGKKTSRPHFGNLTRFFPWTEEYNKIRIVFLFPLVVQWALFTCFGVMSGVTSVHGKMACDGPKWGREDFSY